VEIASYLVRPSYVSFLSGLYLHKFTDQIPLKVQVASPKQKKSISFNETEIAFIKLGPSRIFGYRKVPYGTSSLLLGEPEKVVADSLLLPRYCSISEIWKVIKTNEFDYSKIIGYAKRMRSKVLLKRAGFLLDKAGRDYSKELRPLLSKKYEPLNPLKPKKGEKNRTWNIIVNEVLEDAF